MSALVTGGAGFIGRHVVGELLDRGVAVRVLDDLSRARPGSLEAFRRRSGFLGLAQGDVADPAALRRGLMGVDTVFHLAAAVDVGASVHGPAQVVRANVLGTLNVLGSGAGGAVAPGAGQYLSRLRLRQPSAGRRGGHRAGLAVRRVKTGRRRPGRGLSAGLRASPHHRPTPSTSTGPGSAATWKAAWSRASCRQRWRSGRWICMATARRRATSSLWRTRPCGIVDASVETAVGHTLNLATERETSIRELAALIDAGAGRVRQIPHPHPRAEVERYVGNAARAPRTAGLAAARRPTRGPHAHPRLVH